MTLVKKKRAVLYCRVSSDEQKYNTSLSDQERFGSEFCERKGIILDKVFLEDHSAKTFDRPTWKVLMKYLKANHKYIDYLLFYDFTRFSRNTAEGFTVHDYLVKQLMIYPQSITQWIDYTIPEYVYQLGIYLSGPQVDNVWRSIKTRNGMIARMKEGKWVQGMLPTGYKKDKESGQINHNEKAEYIKMAFDMIYNGMSIADVSRRISAIGYYRSIQSWSKSLRNPFYKGLITNKLISEPVEAINMTPIVSVNRFDAVQSILNGTNPKKEKRYGDYPLKGFCRCGNCGSPLTGYEVNKKKLKSGTYITKKTPIHYYKCNNKYCRINYNLVKMHEDFVDLLSVYSVDEELFPIITERLDATFTQLTSVTVKANIQTKRRLTEIENRIKRLNYSFIDGHIEVEDYNSMKAELMIDKHECEGILKPEFQISNPSEMAKKTALYLKNMPQVWFEGNNETKLGMQNVVFPDGVSYIKEKRHYPTPRVNRMIELLSANTAFKRNKAEPLKSEKLGFINHSSPLLSNIQPLINDINHVLKLVS